MKAVLNERDTPLVDASELDAVDVGIVLNETDTGLAPLAPGVVESAEHAATSATTPSEAAIE